ncbi:NUDIX domain-containing protein, partial [Streptomyces sp. NPDC048845]|uniref:NUDIX hydrolase n=1 Tax=Streptomyces sp. NPDC048845 TaxID=3155390 RepID=UPI00341F7E01
FPTTTLDRSPACTVPRRAPGRRRPAAACPVRAGPVRAVRPVRAVPSPAPPPGAKRFIQAGGKPPSPAMERCPRGRRCVERGLWGRAVTDERYALVAHLAPPRRHTEVVDVHLILRRGEEVLLARRRDTGYADGLLHAPSGHAEDGEDVREAMIREAREETGLDLAPGDLRVALVMQHQGPRGTPRIGWFFEARYGAGGEPVNAEPAKCSEIGWFPLDALPDDMVAYCRAGLDAYRAGDRFVLHRHHPDDSIAHDPTGPARGVPLPVTEPAAG